MRIIGAAWVVLMMAAMCVAQMPPHPQMGGADSHGGMQGGQGVVASSRDNFGMECGIMDSSAQSALRIMRSAGGEWSEAVAGKHLGPSDNAVARVWHERNWMVDMHEAPGAGMTSIHTGQMCFDPQGHITRMIDRYMEMAKCGCMRYTSLLFATDGRVTRRERRFVNASTGSEIEAPTTAGEFPEIWGFRRLEQLPFYSLVKK